MTSGWTSAAQFYDGWIASLGHEALSVGPTISPCFGWFASPSCSRTIPHSLLLIPGAGVRLAWVWG